MMFLHTFSLLFNKVKSNHDLVFLVREKLEDAHGFDKLEAIQKNESLNSSIVEQTSQFIREHLEV